MMVSCYFTHSGNNKTARGVFFLCETPHIAKLKFLLQGNLRHGSYISIVASGHTNQEVAH